MMPFIDEQKSWMLNHQHLAILREVSRAGNVTAAAEQLNLSQPALSHTFRKVDERHGVEPGPELRSAVRCSRARSTLIPLKKLLKEGNRDKTL
ncbi:helix-turn-helix domain-containing protein [Microvirga arsenatis]